MHINIFLQGWDHLVRARRTFGVDKFYDLVAMPRCMYICEFQFRTAERFHDLHATKASNFVSRLYAAQILFPEAPNCCSAKLHQ